jgi:hypothetical protein
MFRVLMLTAALVAACALVPTAQASTTCRTSYAAGYKLRITVLRGTTCRRANEVAAVYLDGKNYPDSSWRCALAHGDPKVSLSCGAGRRGSNLRDWRHAFTAKRVS